MDGGDDGGNDGGGGCGDAEPGGAGERLSCINVTKDVDILFVIDNSGSMGEEQANLSANFGEFIDVLEDSRVQANYRIGVTTTDNGNPRCQGTSPEGGKLQLTSCRARQGDFQFNGNPPVDAFGDACTSICSEAADAALAEGVVPTRTDKDGVEKPRPWIESIEGVTNLPEGVTTTEAFQCFGPQGVSGCGFEQPLESMYKSLTLANNQGSAEFGFLRDNALLAIVFVTDEIDCSHNNEFNEIFSDNTVFWSNPGGQFPTSAVCWNAGVECDGGGGEYSGCEAANYDSSGNPGASELDAVMRPLSRYTDLVQGLENIKKEINPEQDVIVGVISGVPNGYDTFAAEIEYADAVDPVFQDNFGIGPGCQVGTQTAVPPVRLRGFAEHFDSDPDARNLYSVCSTDYTPALQAIADQIADQIRPACYQECAADTNPDTPELDPSCVVEQTVDGETSDVPACVLSDGDWEQPNPDSTVCYVPLVNPDPGQADSISEECLDMGWNVEFLIERVGPTPPGVTITANCELSDTPAVDCPG